MKKNVGKIVLTSCLNVYLSLKQNWIELNTFKYYLTKTESNLIGIQIQVLKKWEPKYKDKWTEFLQNIWTWEYQKFAA